MAHIVKEELRKQIERNPLFVEKVTLTEDRVNVKTKETDSTVYFCSLKTQEGIAEFTWLMDFLLEKKGTFILYSKNESIMKQNYPALAVYRKAEIVEGEVKSGIKLDGKINVANVQKQPLAAVGVQKEEYAEGTPDFWHIVGLKVPKNTKQYPEHIMALIPSKDEVKDFIPDEDTLRVALVCLMNNQPLLLEGHTGVGKTQFVRFLAHHTNNPLICLQASEDMETSTILGHLEIDANGTFWVDGLIPLACREGFWLYFDEINAAPSGVKLAIHNLLDDCKYVVLADHYGERVNAHKNFRMLAACNPADHGAYIGAGMENLAFLNRFSKLRVGFLEEADEIKLLSGKFPKMDKDKVRKLVKSAGMVRERFLANAIMGVLSTRDLKTVCANFTLLKTAIAEENAAMDAALLSVFNKFSKDDQKVVLDLLEQHFPRLAKCRKAQGN